jgi:hypothetical protein
MSKTFFFYCGHFWTVEGRDLKRMVSVCCVMETWYIADKNCALLGCYTASFGNSLQAFRYNLSVSSSRVKNPWCHEAWCIVPWRWDRWLVRKLRPRNRPEERSSYLFRGEILKLCYVAVRLSYNLIKILQGGGETHVNFEAIILTYVAMNGINPTVELPKEVLYSYLNYNNGQPSKCLA